MTTSPTYSEAAEARPVGGLTAAAREMLPELVALRRRLHADPELGLDTPRTQRRVLDALAGLGLEITTGAATTSVVAVLRGALPGPTVLLRGDMDGLPMEEDTGLDFAAENGAMHACGHDLHTAGLVGAARLLAARREELAGDVLFMFQPGEEGAGGARVMIDEGLLDTTGSRPEAAYALHVAPGPRGVVATRPGAAMAGSSSLTITVRGRGGHGSQPHRAQDPVPTAAEIVQGLQTMVARRFDAFEPVVLSVTRLSTDAGAVNIIPDTATLEATVRTTSQAAVEQLREELPRLAEGIASAHGMSAEVDFEVLYPTTINDDARTAECLDVLRETLGAERVVSMDRAAMGSEDFAFVLQQVPGTFFMLLAGPEDPQASGEVNHSPRVIFDDSVLAEAAAALATLAHARLAVGVSDDAASGDVSVTSG